VCRSCACARGNPFQRCVRYPFPRPQLRRHPSVESFFGSLMLRSACRRPRNARRTRASSPAPEKALCGKTPRRSRRRPEARQPVEQSRHALAASTQAQGRELELASFMLPNLDAAGSIPVARSLYFWHHWPRAEGRTRVPGASRPRPRSSAPEAFECLPSERSRACSDRARAPAGSSVRPERFRQET